MSRVRRELADRPFTAAASMLTLGLFTYDLVPFDFVVSTDALHAAFGRAHWGLMKTYSASADAHALATLAQPLMGAGWFSVLGYLLALAGCERGRHPVISLGSAMKDGLILATLVEFMQLFMRSHTFDAATVMFRSLGVMFGAWCAVFLIDWLPDFTRRKVDGTRAGASRFLMVPMGILVALAVVRVGLLVAQNTSTP